MNFGLFWVKLGGSDVTKGVKIEKFRNYDIIISFLSPKDIPIPNDHFIAFYRVFSEFWAILGKIGGQSVTKMAKK